MDEVTITLKRPIEIMVRGALEPCDNALLTAPSSEVRNELLTIHKELSLATFNIAERAAAAPPKDRNDEDEDLVKSDSVSALIRHQEGILDVRTVRQLLRLVEAYGDPHAVYDALERIYIRGFFSFHDVTVTKEVLDQLTFLDIMYLAET